MTGREGFPRKIEDVREADFRLEQTVAQADFEAVTNISGPQD
jgi:hypothetical protein